MSPEQASADPSVDHRADIYAFGVMAYELLTGTLPFAGRSTQAMLAAHAIEKPEPIERRRPGIPPLLGALVMKCLEKRPADRPQTAADLLHDLDAIRLTSAPSRKIGRKGLFIVSGAAAAGLIAGIVLFRETRVQRGSVDQPVGQLRSVAVLPLANIGGDAQDEYFSEGMTDELANALSKLPGLRVASRTSAYAFKGKNINVEEIGKKLHVQAVLEGVVRRSGNRLRVGAQLTDVGDGLAIWSDTYERRTSDVFTVQDDIARSIADALKLKLGSRATELASSSHGTESLEAYDAYLRGRYFWNRRGAANLRKALSYFDESIRKDTAFARAYAGLAITYAILPEYTDNPPANGAERARASATRALALDSTLAEAHTALGLTAVHAWDFHAGEKEYARAIELEPGYATAHQWYGELLYHTGRIDSSLVEMQRAISLDPLAPILPDALGYALTLAGRYKEATDQLAKANELAPGLELTHELLGDVLLQTRETQRAIDEYEEAERLNPETLLTKAMLCHAYGAAGRIAEAHKILIEIRSRGEKDRSARVARAVCEVGLGNNAAALDALEAAVKNHDIAVFTAYSPLLDRNWDPIRGDPRWPGILRAANLGDYIGNARKP
jgi:serine/threonine-protein kinase